MKLAPMAVAFERVTDITCRAEAECKSVSGNVTAINAGSDC